MGILDDAALLFIMYWGGVCLILGLHMAGVLDAAVDILYGPEEIKYVQGEISKVCCKENLCGIVFKDGRKVKVRVSFGEREELVKSKGRKVILKISKREKSRMWYLEDIQLNCSCFNN